MAMVGAVGGCLCGGVRYEVVGAPARVTTCHCTFCQRATGGAFMVQPVFEAERFQVIRGVPKVYAHTSTGSGLGVFVHFCDACGTKLFLTYERFAGFVGVFGGTFDDPDWYERTPANSKHVFLGEAQRGTIIPPHVNTFTEHAMTRDGVPIAPTVFDAPHVIE